MVSSWLVKGGTNRPHPAGWVGDVGSGKQEFFPQVNTAVTTETSHVTQDVCVVHWILKAL